MPPPRVRQQRTPPRPRLTHFLCIPLATAAGRPQLASSLAAFGADVAATSVAMTSAGGGNTRRGPLPPTALRPVGTLHLTLGVLSLGEADRLQQAVERLRALGREDKDTNENKDKPITVALRGLHAMQPPARATVLYAAPVDESTGALAAAGGPLLALCERVRAAFADLLVDEGGRPLLLHATIVNTVYARGGRRGGDGGGGGGGGGGRFTFDARDLLARYEDYVWMERVPVQTVALCRMGAQPAGTAEDMEVDGAVPDAAYPVEVEAEI